MQSPEYVILPSPVKIGDRERVESYSKTLVDGQEQLLITRDCSLFITDGKGGYLEFKTINSGMTREEIEKLINDLSTEVLSKVDDINIKLDATASNINSLINDINLKFKGYVTKEEYDTKIQEIENKLKDIELKKPVGNRGQVYYFSTNGMSDSSPDFILKKANIVETDIELDELKNKMRGENFSNVFNSWQRFSHLNSSQPANTSEMNSWKYDSANNKVICTVNSASYIGFVSKTKYKSYNLSCTFSSTDADDDSIGIVIAFAVDENNIEHTLSAIRTGGHYPENGYMWYIVYDLMQPTQKVLVGKNLNGDKKSDWSSISKGCKVKIDRSMESIKAYTSLRGGNGELSDDSVLEISLNSDEVLSKFKGDCSYGYSCCSQSNSTFTDITFSDGLSDAIYDINNGQTWIYNDKTSKWVITSDRNLEKDIGPGKFLYSEQTGKFYYIDDDNEIIPLKNDKNSTATFTYVDITSEEINEFLDSLD